MKEIILKKLEEIEEKERIRILHCVESGSRAWGFPSPDSDYDVRFIYVRKKEFYLRLNECRDVIEWQLDDTLDINGWDVKKALILLRKSNPTLFEWNNSPIVYKTTDDWQRISKRINGYFLSKHGLYHYLSTAKNNYTEYLKGDKVRLKKYFYVLRPILACKWILEKNSPPPMLFSDLVEECLESELKPVINTLIEKKKKTPELGEGDKIMPINQYIESSISCLTEQIVSLKEDELYDWQEFNEIFLSLLDQNEV